MTFPRKKWYISKSGIWREKSDLGQSTSIYPPCKCQDFLQISLQNLQYLTSVVPPPVLCMLFSIQLDQTMSYKDWYFLSAIPVIIRDSDYWCVLLNHMQSRRAYRGTGPSITIIKTEIMKTGSLSFWGMGVLMIWIYHTCCWDIPRNVIQCSTIQVNCPLEYIFSPSFTNINKRILVVVASFWVFTSESKKPSDFYEQLKKTEWWMYWICWNPSHWITPV